MDAKEAITLAKNFVTNLFSGEKITNLGLEEVEFNEDEKSWRVTLGFSRPWNTIRNPITDIAGTPSQKRTYKVIRISDADKKVLSLKNRADD